jgi:hypothetical protein
MINDTENVISIEKCWLYLIKLQIFIIAKNKNVGQWVKNCYYMYRKVDLDHKRLNLL